MNLLALDTATQACSVALSSAGAVYEKFAIAPRRHNHLLLEMCESVFESANLEAHQLDALAFGRGPGAFVGVRIAAAAAQGIAYAHGLAVIPVSDLSALAQQVFDTSDAKSVLAVIDARMGEIYYGCFLRGDNGLSELDGEERLALPEEIVQSDRIFDCVAGSGLMSYPQLSERAKRSEPDLLPRAKSLLALATAKFNSGEMLTADQALPVYLREFVALPASKKQR